MKITRRYGVFLVILAVLLLAKLNSQSDKYGQLERFRGARLESSVFDPLIAKSINEGVLSSITLDNEPYAQDVGEIYVDDELLVNVSVHFIRNVFDCSARVYDGNRVEIDRGDESLVMTLDSRDATFDGEKTRLSVAPFLHNDIIYMSLLDLCEIFDYGYEWDKSDYSAVISSQDASKVVMPTRFDLRERGRASTVRDQGDASTCWAYASIEALESSMLPEQNIELSANDMIANKPYEFNDHEGGDYAMALSYLLSGKGPVGVSGERFSGCLREAHFFEQDDIDEIKRAVYRYGGVTTSIYVNVAGADVGKSSYYNDRTNSYCYTGSESPNHEVVIIGWDDEYDSANFSGSVGGDGAFICQNSWGDNFGEKGVFYVSYYDTNIGDQAVSYVRVDGIDDRDRIYQSDLCGWTGQIGYNKEDVTAANVYKARADETVTAAGFYALTKNTSYEVFFVPKYNSVSSLAKRQKVASGYAKDAGYYTVAFETAGQVDAGEEFAIVIHIHSPGTMHPMAIEYQSSRIADGYVDITDGEGYVSRNGLDWDDVEEMAGGNLCLKAYARLR